MAIATSISLPGLATDHPQLASAAATGITLADSNIISKLPDLPSSFHLYGKLLRLALISLLLNCALAAVAIVLCGENAVLQLFQDLAHWLFQRPAMKNNPSAALFGAVVATAALTTSIWPIHWAHDEAIRFLHGIELCKRLSRLISRVDFATEHPELRMWAQDITERYRIKRRLGKTALGILFFLIFMTVAMPWLMALQRLGWRPSEIAFVVGLFTPAILAHGIEMKTMIWPQKYHEGFLLGELPLKG
jgi:hypothetical protein